jgi:putative addiction module component (TIGR02574 family)
MSAKQNVIAEALQLSESERLEIAEARLDGPADPGADQAWDAEIRRRIDLINAGKATFLPWSESRRRIAGDDGDPHD